jgi:hypothetical protein
MLDRLLSWFDGQPTYAEMQAERIRRLENPPPAPEPYKTAVPIIDTDPNRKIVEPITPSRSRQPANAWFFMGEQ